MQRDAELLFEKLEQIGQLPETHKTVDGGHDRIEVRHCWALDVEELPIDTSGWPTLSSLCRVRDECHHPDGRVQPEERLFLRP